MSDPSQLLLRSQSEPLSDSQTAERNRWLKTKAGAEVAAELINQMHLLTEMGTSFSLANDRDLRQSTVPQRTVPQSTVPQWITPQSTAFPEPTMGLVSDTSEVASAVHRQTPLSWLMVLVASNILVASLAWSLAKNRSDRPVLGQLTPSSGPSSLIPRLTPIASPQLVSMTACVWRGSHYSEPTVGAALQPGEELNLIEGIAELRMGQGSAGEALVRVEGPAGISIQTGGQLEIRYGRVTVKSLGTGSENVTVHCPIGQVIIDGQSEAGLLANDGVDELHVFTGNAVVRPILADATYREIRLGDGEAVRFSTPSEDDFRVLMMGASMAGFVSARSAGWDRLVLDTDYADAVLDSKPSVYWRFEELDVGSPRRIVNQGSAPDMDATIIGEPAWRRYGNNQVAELGKLGNASAFGSSGTWPAEPLNDYTIELWVKPELYHHGEILCVHETTKREDGRYSHAILMETLAQHWQNDLEMMPINALRFVHRTPASGTILDGSNLVTGTPYQVRTWQHVAAVKRGDELSLWIDGQIAVAQSDPGRLGPGMQVVVGQLYLTRGQRRFVGQLDEIAIYERALTAVELRRHIVAAGRQVSATNP